MPARTADDKWYEAPIVAALLGVVTLVGLVVFLTLEFKAQPAALVKVLGGVTALAGALGGLVYGTRRGKRQGRRETGERVLPVLEKVQAEFDHEQERGTALEKLQEEMEREGDTEVAEAARRARLPDHALRRDSAVKTEVDAAVRYLEEVTEPPERPIRRARSRQPS